MAVRSMASVTMRSLIVALACFVLLLRSNSADGATDKVALVIGNATYSQISALNNTVSDATSMSQSLAKIGFDTRLVTNADGRALRNAIRSFTQRSAGKSVAVVFYAGHGVQVGGDNYLLPVDFDVPRSESDIRISGIKVDDLLAAIQSKVKVVFLDACRDNPVLARSLLSTTRGLAPEGLAPIRATNVGGDAGIFIAFATAAGSVAQDGDGMHSPFTQALLDNLAKPLSIDDMFSLVTKEVDASTQGAQRPYKYASLDSIVCLPDSCRAAGGTAVAKEDTVQTGSTAGPEWLRVGLDANTNRYDIEPSSRKALGNRTLIRVRFTSADRAETQLGGDVFDCNQHTGSNYESVPFRNGERVQGQGFIAPADIVPLMPVIKGSLFDSISMFACGELSSTPDVPKESVFSDDWIGVAVDNLGNKFSVLPSSIHKSGNTVGAAVKEEVLPGHQQPTSSQNGSTSDAFSKDFPIIVTTDAVDCSKGALLTRSTEAWTADGMLGGKLGTRQGEPLVKIARGIVAIPIADYICTKAGERLVLQ